MRSCSLDTWLPEQVEFMARTGNAVANAYWEGGMREGQKPNASSSLTGECSPCNWVGLGAEHAGRAPPCQPVGDRTHIACLSPC